MVLSLDRMKDGNTSTVVHSRKVKRAGVRACLHGGGGLQISEVTCDGSPHQSYKRDQIKMRDYVERRVTSQSGLPAYLGSPTSM